MNRRHFFRVLAGCVLAPHRLVTAPEPRNAVFQLTPSQLDDLSLRMREVIHGVVTDQIRVGGILGVR